MSTEPLNAEDQHSYLSWQKGNKRGKITAGIIIILFGVLFLLDEMNIQIPDWTFSAGPILISIGLISIVKHKFKTIFGYVLVAIGKLLIFNEIYPNSINMNLIWPVLVILLGIAILVRSQRKSMDKCGTNSHFHKEHRNRWKRDLGIDKAVGDLDDISQDDFIDSVSIFGGMKKNVVSKQFRGADIVTIFGGNEINLSQADFTDQIVMDVTNIFGGTTLTVPNNWQIKSEVVTIFGGIEDKRPINATNDETAAKIIFLKGTCMFGGIEINSFNA